MAATKVLINSCKDEEDKPITGEATGTIPSWINGTMIRNGSGLFEIGDTHYNHWFDGMALQHRFHIEKGQATYSNKFLRSERYKTNTEANRIVLGEFGTIGYPDPCQTIWQRFMSNFTTKAFTSDNCNVTVCPYGDKIYVATETNIIYEINPETLDTVDKVDLTSHVAVNHATAHVHVEPDGTVYNMGSSYASGPHYNIIKFPPVKETENKEVLSPFQQASIVAKIPARWRWHPSYYHSFALTENYIVFIEQPLAIPLNKMLANFLFKKNLGAILTYYPKEKSRFYIVKKDTGEHIENVYESSVPFAFFHTINAYEDDGHIVLDMSCYANGNIINELLLDNLRKEKFKLPDTWRFVLPLNVKQGVEEQNTLSYTSCSSKLVNKTVICYHEVFPLAAAELVRINYQRNGKNYRYFYGMGDQQIIKGDWKSKSITSWGEEGLQPSEPIFVKSPNIKEEDDGILLVSVQKFSDPNFVALVIIDAKTMEEISRTSFTTKSGVPATFHGLYTNMGDKIHSY